MAETILPPVDPSEIDAILEQLSAALERDERINLHKYPVEFRVEEGILFLEGTVENIAAKRRARALCRQIVKDRMPIEDYLRRQPTGSMGDRELRDEAVERLTTEPVFSDYSIRTHTEEKSTLVHDGGPDAHEIMIEVADGVITLKGSVGSLSHRRLAETLMWWIYACERVDNRLDVTPPEEDTDNEINDAVQIVIEKDPLVHADQVRVGTAGGVVHLDGLVGTSEERAFAELDAWTVAGVWDVFNRLEVQGQ